MQALSLMDIEIDFCLHCGGLWLDKDELAEFIRKGKIPNRLVSTFCLDMRKMKMKDGDRICPRCSALLKVIDHNGIFIDHCTDCGGFWFDRGELLKALQNYLDEGDKMDRADPLVRELMEGGTLGDLQRAIPESSLRKNVNLRFLAQGKPQAVKKALSDIGGITETTKDETGKVIYKAPPIHEAEPVAEETEEKPGKGEKEHKLFGIIAIDFLTRHLPWK